MRAIEDLERISIELAYAVADCRDAGSRPLLQKLDDVDALLPRIMGVTLAIRMKLGERQPWSPGVRKR
jgi:hypothetical protein